MKITRGQFLDILSAIDPEPQFLAKIVIDTMKRLPKSYSWQLAQQLYLEYYWEGTTITLKNHITNIERKFTSAEEINTYLKNLGYKSTRQEVRNAITRRAQNYCNHQFTPDDEEKEITYFE